MYLILSFLRLTIECQFAQSANGKVYCVYPAAYAEKAAAVKRDIQALQASVSEDFKAERKNGITIMEDTKLGKSISFVNENNRPLTKSQVSKNSISSIETGKYCPTAKLALLICKALNVRFEDIFYFDN